MKKIISAIILGFTCAAFITGNISWTIVTGTKTNFSIKGLLGSAVTGTLDITKSDIKFDAAAPATADIMAVVSVGSINTGNSKRDNHLKTADYFDAASYPEITFKSVAISKTADGQFIASGNLSIKKITRHIDIPFSFTPSGNSAVFKGSFVIKRTDFGVGEKSMLMGNEVTINLSIPVNKKG